MTSRLHQAARAYADRGFAVFPCRPGEKVPAVEHGCTEATTDPAQVDAWWEAMPSANVAVATGEQSGAIVVDVDGDSGIDAWVGLAVDHAGTVPGTLTSATPSGGAHFWFAVPAEVRNSAGKLATNVDVRGTGGYVVVPPSVHPNGGQYRWTTRMRPLPAPGWLLSLLRRKPKPAPPPPAVDDRERADRYTQSAIDGEIAAVAACGQGARNDTLYRAAFKMGTLVGAGLTDSEHVSALLEQAAASCGLVADDGERSVRKTIQSGLSGGIVHPRDRSAA